MKLRERVLALVTGEAARYLFFGGCTTMVNLVSFWALCRLSPLGQSEAGINGANVLSVALAILFAYGTNKVFVFRSVTHGVGELLGEMARFVGARLATMALEVGGVWLVVSVLHQDPMAGKLATQGLVVVGNYAISKLLVFKRRGVDRT